MSSVFIDSNVIIKYFAGDSLAKKVLEPIIYGDATGYVNIVVISEVIFILLKLLTGKKAYELKDSPETVKNVFKSLNTQIQFLREYFSELEINERVKQIAMEVMREYGLLPNDALIASACRHYGIDTILTFDEDFKRIPWLRTIP
ncbi:MAG: type II toxin-antitoxin system VapC family toxin [Sulfolobales archaeon]